MLKIITPTWDFGVEPTALIKAASNGLRGGDFNNFVKRAGEKLAAEVRTFLRPDKGEEYVHVIALGSLEYYGCNRRGDAFPEDVCKKYHHTFTKHAKWYRHHHHHDPEKSYGVVKMSNYDNKYKRVDLVVALNATKTAAERNRGHIADIELEKLYKGETLPVSMACVVSYDICSGCGNKAKNRNEYCDERRCVKYGGCKDNLGKTFDDGHTLHVINPDPIFFDISYVTVPADRIAFSVGLLKSATISAVSSDAAFHNLLYKIPARVSNKDDECEQTIPVIKDEFSRKIASDLLIYESHIPDRTQKRLISATFSVADPISLLSASYRTATLLPSNIFFTHIYPSVTKVGALDSYVDVGNCVHELYRHKDADALLYNNPYDITPYPSCMDDAVRDLKFQLNRNEIISTNIKIASDDLVRDRSLVSEYARYLIAWVKNVGNNQSVLHNAVLQNKIVV